MLNRLRKILFSGCDTDESVKGSHRRLGAKGEKFARKFLSRKGCKILGKNYRTPAGEVDIVALDGDSVVFCEVKTRSGDFVDPESAIDKTRRSRYRRAAKFYLSQKHKADLQVRFDVIFVMVDDGGQMTARHVENAF